MNAHNRVQFDLDENEREVLRRALMEWAGPAAPTEAMAVAMGFRDVADLFAEGERIAAFIQAGRSLTKGDWRRALLATEIVFASNTVGAGLVWKSREAAAVLLRRGRATLFLTYCPPLRMFRSPIA
ncbi:UNVERIFIED_ORG: hypothetical protein J3D58_003046 [Paenarthrobacter nicotinovorans]